MGEGVVPLADNQSDLVHTRPVDRAQLNLPAGTGLRRGE